MYTEQESKQIVIKPCFESSATAKAIHFSLTENHVRGYRYELIESWEYKKYVTSKGSTSEILSVTVPGFQINLIGLRLDKLACLIRDQHLTSVCAYGAGQSPLAAQDPFVHQIEFKELAPQKS